MKSKQSQITILILKKKKKQLNKLAVHSLLASREFG